MGMVRTNKSDDKRKFQMREKLMSIGDDYWIEDESGNKAFKVDGKAMHVRNTWVLEDAQGREVASMNEHKLGRDHVEVELGKDLKVHGHIADHEYEIERDGDKIAEISKKWFRMRDTYGVEIEHDADTVLVLAVTVAVDAMSHDLG